MEFLLRVTCGDPVFDAEVNAEPSHTVDDLIDALAKLVGFAGGDGLVAYRSTGEYLSPWQTIGEVGLTSGETISLIPEQAEFESGVHFDSGQLVVVVTAGPDSGQKLKLTKGEFGVGRSPNADVALQDPYVTAMSDSHFNLCVDESDNVTLFVNPTAVNQVRVNGVEAAEACPIGLGDVVRLGATSLRLRRIPPKASKSVDVFGQTPFYRTPYYPAPVQPTQIDAVSPIPQKPEPNRFMYLSAVAPVVMGLFIFFIFERYYYLFFMVLGPVMVIGNFLDQRYRIGKKFRKQVERFREDVKAKVVEVNEALLAERRRWFIGAPDISDLADRAEHRTVDLWVRDRDAADFLNVRVGTGPVESKVDLREPSSGDRNFVDEMNDALGDTKNHLDVPFAVELAELGAISLVGPTIEVAGLAAAMVAQLGCLHSPEDMIIFSAATPERSLNEWLKWLPHTRSASSPIGGPHLVTGKEATDNMMREIYNVAAERAQVGGRQTSHKFPWLVILLDNSCEPDPAVLSRLLDLCPAGGASVLWLTGRDDRIPRQAKATVTCRPLASGQMSVVSFTDPERPDQEIYIEHLDPRRASDLGRSLAPLRDATSVNAATAIPKIVSLYSALAVDDVTADLIIGNWKKDRGYALPGPIGMTESGQMVLDLVQHGPHGLIGGTSGAGKSELLMSFVAGMIAYNPPTRINFLFIDYKGGASSDLFKEVPHTVGYVTNLDGLLSMRALISLRAELDRRMNLMQGRAKDIAEMIEKFPDEAPPSLVIVIDEFATLVKEIPDFVAGMVDIAQRGRSLGIHLILATQRPSGAINENIKANTNLRISLRMLDNAESTAVIGTKDAAEIPGPLKGRGYARFGPGDLIAFQSAWSGAPRTRASGPSPVVAQTFTTLPVPKNVVESGSIARHENPMPAEESAEELTQVDRVIESVVEAAQRLSFERGRTPWKDELPTYLPLNDVLANPRLASVKRQIGRHIVVGMTDSPQTQDQFPSIVDLEESGGLLVFGTGGSGKSSFLQTVAASAAYDDSKAGGGHLTIFGLDFASRELLALNRLPQCGGIGTSDNIETVTRIIVVVEQELERRRRIVAAAAERAQARPSFDRILLLIDSYENLIQAFETGPSSRVFNGWLGKIESIITEGRQVGIHSVIATPRRTTIRNNLSAAVASRLFFKQTEVSNYAEVGVKGKDVKDFDLSPGQGFLNSPNIFQAATLASEPLPVLDDSFAFSMAEALTPDRQKFVDFVKDFSGTVADGLQTKALEADIAIPARGTSAVKPVVGVCDLSIADYALDITYNNVAVIGDPRSGRSNLLAVVAQQVHNGGGEVWLLGPEGSGLQRVEDCYKRAFGSIGEMRELLAELETELANKKSRAKPVLIFDDADLVDDRNFNKMLTPILGKVRWIGASTGLRGYSNSPIVSEMKKARTVAILRPADQRVVLEAANTQPNWRPGLPMPEGRGVVVADRVPTYVQFFRTTNPPRV